MYKISPPGNDSFRKDLCFAADVFLFFISTQDLWDLLADRCKILHGGHY